MGSAGGMRLVAPVLVAPDEDFEAMTVWPWTSTNDWCGEWKQRPTRGQGV